MFGDYVRSRREALKANDNRYTLRKLAERVRVHHSFLSKIERGESVAISEQKITALAFELGEDPDLLLAMRGKISSDIQKIILARPLLFTTFIREMKDQPDQAIQTAEEMFKTHEELSERVRRQTGELRQANERLRGEINERLRVEQELRESGETLRESHALLQAILDNSRAVVYIKDVKGRYQLINRQGAELMNSTPDSFIGRTNYDFYPSHIADEMLKNDRLVMESGVNLECEEIALLPDGEHVYLTDKFPFRNLSGEIVSICGISTDITERKRAGEALRHTRQVLDEAQEIAHLGSWEWNTETNEEVWSDEQYRIFGYEPGEVGATYNYFVQALHPEDRDRVLAAVQDALDGVRPYHTEFRIVLPDKSEKHILAQAEVHRDANGEATRMVGTSLDITERKRAEEALKCSEARYALAQRAANIGSWEWDVLTGDLYWSDRIEPMFGFDPGQFGRTYEAFLDCVHPEDRQLVIDSVKACLEGQKDYAVEHRIVWPDGRLRWMAESGDVQRDDKGRPVRMYGVVRDITERKRTEEELRQLTRAVEQSQASIVITDKDGAIEYVNPYFFQITGYNAEETFGNNPRMLKSGQHPDSFYQKMWKALTSGTAWSGEICNKRKDKSLFWEYSTVSPLRDEQGRTTHYVAVKKDITERKRAEEALRESEERYRNLFEQASEGIFITDKNLNVIDANFRALEILGYDALDEVIGLVPTDIIHPDDLKKIAFEKSMSKIKKGEVVQIERRYRKKNGEYLPVLVSGAFMQPSDHFCVLFVDITERKRVEEVRQDVERIMRHNLKTPLAGIIGLTEAVLEENYDQRLVPMLRMIQEQGRGMLKQVNWTLDLFKMETGCYRFCPRPTDMVGLITKLIANHTLKIGRGVKVAGYVRGAALASAEPFFIQTEEHLTRQMLANLLQNAVEASPAGETVTFGIDEEGSDAVLTVHNLGMVAEPVRETFFDKYTTHGKSGGTGLGTYSAKLMAETMGGSIGFISSETEGTTVTVRLPRG